MSDLIPNITEADFIKLLQQGKIKELKSCEVIGEDYSFTAIIPHGDMFAAGYGRTQAEYLGVKTNIVGGVNPDEILTNQPSVQDKKLANLAKARAVAKANREAREVVQV